MIPELPGQIPLHFSVKSSSKVTQSAAEISGSIPAGSANYTLIGNLWKMLLKPGVSPSCATSEVSLGNVVGEFPEAFLSNAYSKSMEDAAGSLLC